MIKLDRPIAFFDLETTSAEVETARIVQIAICKLNPDWSIDTKEKFINPEMPIPPQSTAIHGITDDMVADAAPFKRVAKGLLALLDGCDLGGFNSNRFDIPVLVEEFARAGIDFDYSDRIKVDVFRIFQIDAPRNLSAAVEFYLNRKMENAHDAKADIEATVDVLKAQLLMHKDNPDFPDTLQELETYCNNGKQMIDVSGKFSYDENGEIIFTFGKHKDQPVQKHLDFLDWMIGPKNTFTSDVKAFAKKFRYPRQ